MVLLSALLFSALSQSAPAAQPKPQFHWSFDRVQKRKSASSGLRKTPINIAKWSKDGGVGGSGALVCGEKLRSVKAHFPELQYTKATIELSFKPTTRVKRSTLFSYGETSWNRAGFDISLDGKRHVFGKFRFVTRVDGQKVEKERAIVSREHEFAVGEWYTVRVTMEQGGSLKIYVNGRLENMASGSMSLADFTGEVPQGFPVVQIGSLANDGTAFRPFTGLIDDVRIWNSVVGGLDAPATPPTGKTGAPNAAVIMSKRITTRPMIDGKLDDDCWKEAEITRPFKVLGHPHPTIEGQWLDGEKKFVETAATVQVCHDDENLYVAYRADAPKDTPAKAKVTRHDGPVWAEDEDCVELFIDPMQRMGFYQILANAIGTVADLESPPGTGGSNFDWESKADVKAQRDGPGFVVEMAVPFASLDDAPRTPGTAWGINFTREGSSGGGLSTWAPVGTSFGTPQRFGLLIFESRKAYHVKELARIEEKLAGLSAEKSPKLADSAKGAIEKLKSRIQREGDRVSSWTALRNVTDELDATVRQIALAGRSYVLWRKDIWGDISPNEKVPFGTEALEAIHLFTARNTRAATGFLVTNLTAKTLMGRLITRIMPRRVKPPEGTAWLDRKHFRFRKALYVELNNKQMIADPLVDLPPYGVLEIPPRTTTLVWLEVETRGLEPGKYTRTIDFFPSYSGFGPTSFDLNVEVAPVDLSAPKVMQWTYMSDINRTRFPYVAEDLARHGVTTVYFMPGRNNGYPEFDKEGNIVSMDHTTLDTMIGNMVEAGVAIDCMSVVIPLGLKYGNYRHLPRRATPDARREAQLEYGTEAWKKGFANALKSIRDHLFEKGFTYQQIIIYPVDEPWGDPNDPKKGKAYLAFEGARYIKAVDPKFRIMANPTLRDDEPVKYLSAYLEMFDVLCPYYGRINANLYNLRKRLRESSREIWTYGILGKKNGPTAYRNMSWRSAREGYAGPTPFWCYERHMGDGFYSYDHHEKNPRKTTDYGVVYEDSEAGKLIGSRRWEGSYQGNQDFRAVVICRELIAKLAAAGKDASSFRKTLDQTIEGALTASGAQKDAAREKLIRLAVRMQELLAK